MAGYISGGNTGISSPQELKRRRELAQAMMLRANARPARNAIEGVNSAANSLLSAWMTKRADKAEAAGREDYRRKLMAALSGMGGGALTSGAAVSGDRVAGHSWGSSRSPGGAGAPPAAGAVDPGYTLPPDDTRYTGEPAAMAGGWTPEHTARLEQAESGGDPNAVSPKGATGVRQVMPTTAMEPGYGVRSIFDMALDRGIEVKARDEDTARALLANPDLNREFSDAYIGAMDGRFGGDPRLTAAAYNAGPGAVQRAGGVPNYPETQTYVDKVAGPAQAPAAPADDGFAMQMAQAIQSAPQTPAAAPGSPQGARGPAGVSPELLAAALTHPHASAGGSGFLEALVQADMKARDPMADLRRRKMEAEIVKLERPERPDDPIAALRARAQAAGLKEGTPEFADFMRTGGRTQDKRIIYGPDGNPVYAEGVDPSAIKLTEQQSKDLVYFDRADGAARILDDIDDALTSPGGRVADSIPLAGNYLLSPEYQQAKQASAEWLAAILRKDTGAAITSQEFDLYGPMYLPQPGDGAEVLTQKRAARTRATNAIKRGLGTAQILAEEMLTQRNGPPPEGVTPQQWNAATPEQRKALSE